MNDDQIQPLSHLVATVQQSPKYRNVSHELIARIGSQELAKRRNVKAATKATKNKLHQIGGAYLDYKPNFSKWLQKLEQAKRVSEEEVKAVCREIISHHSSTRERLPVLDDFYQQTLSDIAPIRSVADFAAGLNPLAAPWMPLSENAEYYAYDIYSDLIDFLNHSLVLLGVRGHAETCDVLQLPATPKTDVAFLLKAIPCLEQLDKAASSHLLNILNADHLLVSFPARTLCGRSKGMAAHYEARFQELIAGRQWSVKRFEFETELVFRLSK